MNKDKQIKEMCSIMSHYSLYRTCEDVPQMPDGMGICDAVSCERCRQARGLLDKGYRKSSDVASEIFEEIDSTINLICAMTGLNIRVFGKYAELKKKYKSEGTE